MSDRRPARDSGQVMSALAILVMLGLVFVLGSILLPIGDATVKRTTARTAADAAALAGVKGAREEIVRALLLGFADQDDWTDVFAGGLGSGAAIDYAARNRATVTGYRYDWQDDRATVYVRGTEAVEGQYPESAAAAELGVDWSSCRWDRTRPTPTPTPTPTQTPPPDDDEDEDDEAQFVLECDGLDLEFRLADDRFELVTTADDLRNALRPRLVPMDGTGAG